MKLCVVTFSILYLCGTITNSCYAKNFSYKNKKYSLDISENWKVSLDVLGVPVSFSGPVKNRRRPVIMFTPTNIKKMKFTKGQFKKDIAEYKSSRKLWIKKHNGKLRKFDEFSLQMENGSEFHRVGFHYNISNNEFSEASYYVVCKKELFHLKYLVSNEQTRFVPEIEKAIVSFKCE